MTKSSPSEKPSNTLAALSNAQIASKLIEGARRHIYYSTEDVFATKVIQEEGYRICLGDDVHVDTLERRRAIAKIVFPIALHQAKLLEGGRDGEIYNIIARKRAKAFIELGLWPQPAVVAKKTKPVNNDHEDDCA